jgi:hypothetical protein
MAATLPSPIAAAAAIASPSTIPWTSPWSSPTTSFVGTVKPSSLGSWPARMIRAMPFM